MHFGNTVTSRVEGIHALLKSYLKSSKFNLFDVWRTIKHTIENQLSELQSTQARQQTRKPTKHTHSGLFNGIHGWVSHKAMKKVEMQLKLLEKTDPPVSSTCSGSFTKSYGLPCVHKLKSLLESRQSLTIEDFHRQWHLRRNKGQPPLVLEPTRVESRILRDSRIPQSSTRRESSAFERLGARAPSTCSRCHAVGHSRRSRTYPLRHQEIILESSVPNLAGPRDPMLAAAGWSQEAEAVLAGQTQDIVIEDATQNATGEEGQDAHEVAAQDVIHDTIVVQCRSPQLEQPEQAMLQPSPLPSEVNPATPEPASCPVLRSPSLLPGNVPDELPHHAPESIYKRYIAARLAWYSKQPRGSVKTNQAYRSANGLPLRYRKEIYE